MSRMRGRKPDLTRQTTGSGNRPVPEPPGAALDIDDLRPPGEMNEAQARWYWHYVEELNRLRGLKPSDLDALSDLANHRAMYEMLDQKYRMEVVANGADTDEAKRIGVRRKDEWRMVRDLWAAFGLTPTDGVRLGLGKLKGAALHEMLVRRENTDQPVTRRWSHSNTMQARSRCAAEKADGSQCARWAADGSEFCWQHD
jgi:hypothetical protein